MVVLLLPKLMGLARALARPTLRRGCGGAIRLVASFIAELVVSALLAPIMMVVHSRQVYEILLGRDAGWSPQRRDDGETRWADAWRWHRWHMACGLAMAGAAWFLSPGILAWLLADGGGASPRRAALARERQRARRRAAAPRRACW